MAVLALTLGSIPAPARSEGDDYARRGLYLGAGASYIVNDFDLPEATATSGGSTVHLGVHSGDSWGAEGRVGYRVHPNVAVEGQLQYYDDFGIDVQLAGGPNASRQVLSLDGASLMGNVKGYPLTGCIQPYGLLGIGLLWLRAEDTVGAGFTRDEVGFAGRIGAGVDGYVTRNLLLNLEASCLVPSGDLRDFRAIPISVGLQYRFD